MAERRPWRVVDADLRRSSRSKPSVEPGPHPARHLAHHFGRHVVPAGHGVGRLAAEDRRFAGLADLPIVA